MIPPGPIIVFAVVTAFWLAAIYIVVRIAVRRSVRQALREWSNPAEYRDSHHGGLAVRGDDRNPFERL